MDAEARVCNNLSSGGSSRSHCPSVARDERDGDTGANDSSGNRESGIDPTRTTQVMASRPMSISTPISNASSSTQPRGKSKKRTRSRIHGGGTSDAGPETAEDSSIHALSVPRSSSPLPRVLACGHYCISSSKTNLQFPTFLIRLPTHQQPHVQNQRQAKKAEEQMQWQRQMLGQGTQRSPVDGESDATSQPASSVAPGSVACKPSRWRSKRDFLLLGRAAASTLNLRLPKSALSKLSANTPWMRPRDSGSDGVATGGGSAAAAAAAVSADTVDEVEDACAQSQATDHYHPSMKKSLYLLESFLQAIHHQHSTFEQLKEAWMLFCRPTDTEGCFPIAGEASVDPCERIQSTCANSDGIVEAVHRPHSHQAHHSKSVHGEVRDGRKCEEISPSPQPTMGAPAGAAASQQSMATTTYRSSKLGQYFAAPENAERVVEILFENHVQPHLSASCNYPIIFLEPSCGHGDIIHALTAHLARLSVPNERIAIIGMDLDPNAIDTCRRRDFVGGYSITWSHGDFLNSKHSDGSLDVATCHGAAKREQSHQKVQRPGGNNGSSNGSNSNRVLFCLGGPPYSAGAGNGSSDMMRDLPGRFVRHCVEEWDAKAVCFLMPARCKQSPNPVSANTWHCRSFRLSNSKFYFQGSQIVTQPSIIQLFFPTNATASLLPPARRAKHDDPNDEP